MNPLHVVFRALNHLEADEKPENLEWNNAAVAALLPFVDLHWSVANELFYIEHEHVASIC